MHTATNKLNFKIQSGAVPVFNIDMGSFTNYVMPLRWVGGQQNITIAIFIR